MATDPAAQAAANALAQNMGSGVGWQHWLPLAEVVVAAVTPLIRAQAFTEAATLFEESAYDEMARWWVVDKLRGLGEETENA